MMTLISNLDVSIFLEIQGNGYLSFRAGSSKSRSANGLRVFCKHVFYSPYVLQLQTQYKKFQTLLQHKMPSNAPNPPSIVAISPESPNLGSFSLLSSVSSRKTGRET